MRYEEKNIVLMKCEHERVMLGESDEVVRRTRSQGAEDEVLNAIKGCNAEPDWFVERWIEEEGVLVAAAVFDDAERSAGFRKAIEEYHSAKREADAGYEAKVMVMADDKLAKGIAEHFNAEWERQHGMRVAEMRGAIAKANGEGEYDERVLVGAIGGGEESAKVKFEGVAKILSKEFGEGDGKGEGELLQAAFWDGEALRFCFGIPNGIGDCVRAMEKVVGACDEVSAEYSTLGAVEIEKVDDVTLQLCAAVVSGLIKADKADKANNC